MMSRNSAPSARRRARRAAALLAGVALAACRDGSSPSDPEPVAPAEIDCTLGNAGCPALELAGDQPARLTSGQPSPARGFADPSLRKDPRSATLWMAYSWPYIQGTVRVESHLARSDDGGATWRFLTPLWRSVAAVDEEGNAGWLNSEVVSLAPRVVGGATVWYSARLRYFTRGGPVVPSFTIQIATASSPEALATAEEATLGGDQTHAHWRPQRNLASLSPELSGCSWNDPGLLYHSNALYLAMQCSIYVAGREPPERQFVAVFTTQPSGAPSSWSWRYLGKLAGHAEAVELGGEMLMQTDIAVGRDGQLLAIFSPSRSDVPLAAHYGCRVVEVVSLDPPRLARDSSGRLRVRAVARASDLLPSGPGACGYDAESATGLILTRRVLDAGQLVVSLHRTGLRP